MAGAFQLARAKNPCQRRSAHVRDIGWSTGSRPGTLIDVAKTLSPSLHSQLLPTDWSLKSPVRGGDQGLELVVLVGLQASGKSTFCDLRLAASHTVVSKDAFGNARHRQRRQMHLVNEALSAGRSVVLDNTNPSPAEWQPLIDAGRAHGATVVGYWFPPDLEAAAARNAARDERSRVPDVGFYTTLGRLRQPSLADGFDGLFTVSFDGAGGFLVEPMADEDGRG